MNKYIPKVGEAFKWRSTTLHRWNKAGNCIVHSINAIGFECRHNGSIISVNKECDFRPIPTKADVEREILRVILDKPISKLEMINRIEQANFTIPKKIKRSDIENTILDKFCSSHVLRCYLVTAIYELLGDLVEQDEKAVDCE